ncbi:hypothetical protein L2E82_47015 [Cichorium intybus]|uniref:Uncharacterized protein n=1 Tax=Cichorium intybus TaxID=13427 RepID=A0ACB8YUW8_CICIN|nr:hypothetical protein L2E82_47015 [Cichorium intybus]
MAGDVRTGGKGSVRRKKKAVHKRTTTDDKRLQSTLKRIGVNAIPTIEEVNIFKDETVIQFLNPKAWAICEHLLEVIKEPTLFAAHFHEFTALGHENDGQTGLGATISSPTRNEDMSSTAFIEPLPIKKALRGVKVEVTQRGNMRRKYRMSGLTSQATRELNFEPLNEESVNYCATRLNLMLLVNLKAKPVRGMKGRRRRSACRHPLIMAKVKLIYRDQALEPLESTVSQINDNNTISISTLPLISTGIEDHVPDIDKKKCALKKKPFPTRQCLRVGGHQGSMKIDDEIGGGVAVGRLLDVHVSGEKAFLFDWRRLFPTKSCDCGSMEHYGIMAFSLLYVADSIWQKALNAQLRAFGLSDAMS